jgi:hypothetical protein
MADATQTLHLFALQCARRVLAQQSLAGQKVSPLLWSALRAKEEWLNHPADKQHLLDIRAAIATMPPHNLWPPHDLWEIIWAAVQFDARNAALFAFDAAELILPRLNTSLEQMLFALQPGKWE